MVILVVIKSIIGSLAVFLYIVSFTILALIAGVEPEELSDKYAESLDFIFN
jgi:hypothetical protein